MPCDGATLTDEQVAARQDKLRDLERQITAGKVTVKRKGTSVEFAGWETDRTGPGHLHDACTLRLLTAKGSSALRMALARMPETDRRALQQAGR